MPYSNTKLSAIIIHLKSNPPFNFHVALKTHAMALGLKTHTPSMHESKLIVPIELHDARALAMAKHFVLHIPEKYPHVKEAHLSLDAGKYLNPHTMGYLGGRY